MKNRETETFTLRCETDGKGFVELHIPMSLHSSFEEHMSCLEGKHMLACFFEKFKKLSAAEREEFQAFLLHEYMRMLSLSDLLPMLNAMCFVIERKKATR